IFAIMSIILFTKMLIGKTIDETVEFAAKYGFEGLDLALREGYPVNPGNMTEALPILVRKCKGAGLSIPMVTGEGNLLNSKENNAEKLVKTLADSGIPLLKLGYFTFPYKEMNYWQEVDRIRAIIEDWEKLASKCGIKICLHTHSNGNMGMNCSAMMHLIKGFDPKYIGAYIDPGHMVVEGEEFSAGLAIVGEYLCAVALKDVALDREDHENYGTLKPRWTKAGVGVVDWPKVFSSLAEIKFEGSLTVHYQFKFAQELFDSTIRSEIDFFKWQRGILFNKENLPRI
ncbi:MAG: sugar phosphate isomerase/epimerase, partial [Candidatus Contubernalis sp.]|nr:sugar phosphate isomerase/epimerase [Candidatus Contubernalis sp.]